MYVYVYTVIYTYVYIIYVYVYLHIYIYMLWIRMPLNPAQERSFLVWAPRDKPAVPGLHTDASILL